MPDKIHLADSPLDPRESPVSREGFLMKMNCGTFLVFSPIAADWDDGRVCEECLKHHRETAPGAKFTFAIFENDNNRGVSKEDMLDLSIDNCWVNKLGGSCWARNVLAACFIKTIRDLCQYTEQQVLERLNSFSWTTGGSGHSTELLIAPEVRAILGYYGLGLRD